MITKEMPTGPGGSMRNQIVDKNGRPIFVPFGMNKEQAIDYIERQTNNPTPSGR
jgi:hypothetical protein